jgi:signal transduction histidine kinase
MAIGKSFERLVWTLMVIGVLSVVRAEAQEEVPLTPITGIRQLSSEEAAKGFPVRVRGVVTFSNKAVLTLFIHDGNAGLFVKQVWNDAKVWPEQGDQVEVTGVTNHGVFAPVITGLNDTSPEIVILNKGELPPPRPVDALELARPDLDCDWVTLEADVTEVMMEEDALVLECRAGSFDFHVLIEGPLPPESVPWDLAESRVRIRGVVATIFNSNRQMTRRFLRVSSPADVVALRVPGKNKEALLVESSQLLRVNGPGPNDFVKVRGVVTFNLPGRGMFLRTDGGGLWVQTARIQATNPGTAVEVEGWPRAGTMKPLILATGVEILDHQKSPLPLNKPVGQLLDSHFESDLVACEAELLNVFRGADGTTLELRDGPVVFRGWLDLSGGQLPDLKPGSKLRVAGIAQITSTGEFAPFQEEDKLLLRLRAPADVVLLKMPPWWTPTRVTLMFSGILFITLIVYQRSRMRRRRRLESQRKAFEAVLAERGRFAREIHDSLAQGLTSISMQLECVRSQLSDAPEQAREHLETARKLVRESMREARRTIWNLRPLALGEANLASAFQKFARDLTNDINISCEQQIEGTPRPLPHEHENALLRIGQESLTNAVRHAHPRSIQVRLRFGDGWVTLVVKDDGHGFDVADRVGKGYGLTGMHERVDALGGSLSIDSRPDEGTEVSVTLPT